MSNANTVLYDRTIDRAAMIRLYEQNAAKKLNGLLDAHEAKTIELIRQYKGKLTPELREAIDKQLRESYGEIYSVNSKSLLDLVKDQVSYTYQNLSNAIGKIWSTARPSHRVAEDIVLSKPLYKDVTLAKGWASVNIAEKKRLEAVIRSGIAEGLSEDDIALSIRKGNVFNISRHQSLGLARTAMTSVYAQADQEVYKANEKALRGWQYVAVLDSRTTPLCAHRDGTIYPVGDVAHLPPAHWHCRSTTVPVVKNYAELQTLEGVSQIRKRNLQGLTEKQIAYYDGETPLKESYNDWLKRQPESIQLKHLGDSSKLKLFQSGDLSVEKFQENGRSLSLQELRQATGVTIPGETRKFADAKDKLDRLKLGVSRPEDLLESKELQRNLREYYKLQSGELDGILSYTNYRGTLLHTKKAQRQRVLNSPPTEDNLRFNPLTNRYDDARMYQPNTSVYQNNLRLVRESESLKQVDKDFIENFVEDLGGSLGMNERAVVADNLRIIFTRFRDNKEPWANFKAVLNSQIKFDVMNVSDFIETQLRRDSSLFNKLNQLNYLDPVLGPQDMQELHDSFIDNIFKMREWEYNKAPKIARQLRNILDRKIPPKLLVNLDEQDLKAFYLKFAKRLSMADTPDRDQLAVALGRDLYNSANYRGSRNEWYNLGVKLLDDAKSKGFYELDTYGVQKRRMKSRNGNRYFGPYYDTFSVNVRITNPDILEYAKLTRKVDVGLRIGVTTDKNRLRIREGFKTYFDYKNRDTGIPITSVDSFMDFPADLIDGDMTKALNWAANSQFKVDKDFYDFVEKLIYFQDDKGKAAFYDGLNAFKHHLVERGDTYERFKAMAWLKKNDTAFSNHPFLDHRGRIYERGFIGPQAGETFRPFLNTAASRNFNEEGFYNLQDQIGSFIGGLSDNLEGHHNSLSQIGRQKIAEKWRPELVKLGNHILRNKPNDIRSVLESPFMAEIDGEDQGKALRLALEVAKIDNFLRGDYSKGSVVNLRNYKINIALEQDASSSGAQIIALTTRNKQLAQLSNVVPTNQKQRLYDEIAASTYRDPRFIELNKKLGLTEKDLRKAAKAQNMVTFYGAGERTGIMNVEGKLAKVLGKDEGRLVVKAAERDAVLNEISARMARYEKFDTDTYLELKALRQDVKDIFNKGLAPGDDIMEQLYFLDPKTRDLVEKMSRNYDSVVTPDDFAQIATIMSENLRSQVPILKDFTRFFGRLAEAYVTTAKPSESFFDWKTIAKRAVLGSKTTGKKFHPRLSEALGVNPKESISEKLLKRFDWYKPKSTFSELLYGIQEAELRRTGAKVAKLEVGPVKISEIEVLYPNKLPKSWTKIPWVNFDGKTIEQKFTQTFEERLRYRDADGNWVTNIIQVKQKTDPVWWESLLDKDGKINDIVDAQKARTAFAVNGNHSNDATLVKQFHLWGADHNTSTATIHDAFFTNAADMMEAKKALRLLYARALEGNSIRATLDEMLARGLPKEVYDQYLDEAIEIGLIPVVGRSSVGGRLINEDDILTVEDILESIPDGFKSNRGWYGIG